MSKQQQRQLVMFGLVLAIAACAVEASGVFELRLKSFANENGKDSLGKCCSGQATTAQGRCAGVCRTRFRVCLKQYQVNIDTTTPCTYGDVVTPVLSENSLSSASNLTRPIRFPFDFTWPGTFSLIVEAFHDSSDGSGNSTGSASERVIITRLATQRWLDVGPEWIEDVHSSHHSAMIYQYRVTCSAHYYGKGCENLCRPRDDNFGHYRCSPTGERVCLSGWKGDYCASPHCLAGCDEQHGHCSRPNECSCHNGWTGEFCDQCERYPGCLHGSCQKPWECLCDEGWGGLFCNQDLNFCTNHKPCRNGGTCFNTGEGSYTCSCAPGFTGTDCETPLLDCQSQPCLNQASCVSLVGGGGGGGANASIESASSADGIGRRYRCACPAGWRGRHCEVSSRSCRDSPCARGATCEDSSERGFTCHCPAGFSGADCAQQIDECASNPCANGGTCADLTAGFRCTCPPGFSGQQCQVNVDDCQPEPCLNGATCVDLVNKFRCQCATGYTGKHCAEKVDYCQYKVCANGGNCTSTASDWKCICRPGFAGRDCSLVFDECKSSPCLHGGTCRNRHHHQQQQQQQRGGGGGGFACDCPDGWRGETCAEPAAALPGYWSADRPRGHAAVAASPEARHAALSTEHVVVIATISTAVPAFVLVAALAVMCMKRRQKREQAKADEEARLQNERNAVHSSMSKRAVGALLPPGCEPGGAPGCHGDSHMIKNTWTAAVAAAAVAAAASKGKSINNADNLYDEGYKPEPMPAEARQRSTKQLNTEAAAHRASQHFYQKDRDSCASVCQMLVDSKRSSTLFSADATCCSASSCADLKRPNASLAETPPGDLDSACSPVYVIDEHYRRDPRDTLATEV